MPANILVSLTPGKDLHVWLGVQPCFLCISPRYTKYVHTACIYVHTHTLIVHAYTQVQALAARAFIFSWQMGNVLLSSTQQKQEP